MRTLFAFLGTFIFLLFGSSAYAGYFKNYTWKKLNSAPKGIFTPEFYPTKAVIINGSLYSVDGTNATADSLTAAILSTGVELWRFDPSNEYLPSQPAVTDFSLGAEDGDVWARDWTPVFQTQDNKINLVDYDADLADSAGNMGRMEVGLAWQNKVSSVRRISLPLIFDGGNLICNSTVCLMSDRIFADNSAAATNTEKDIADSILTTSGNEECTSKGCVYTPIVSKYLDVKSLKSDSDFVLDGSAEVQRKSLTDLMAKVTRQKFDFLPRIQGEPTGHVDMFAAFVGEHLCG